jgi:hypothetical protein
MAAVDEERPLEHSGVLQRWNMPRIHRTVIVLQCMAARLDSMAVIETNRRTEPKADTLREMFPWLTVLLVFLCLTSLFGESKEAKGSLVEAVGAASAVSVPSLRHR